MKSLPSSERISRRLRTVRLLACADLILLCALVSAALTRQHEIVQVLGPLHGINFLLLLAMATTAALDGLWGWWFPLAILLSAGPPGAFVGEWLIQRRIQAARMPADAHKIPATDKTTTSGIASTQPRRMVAREEDQI